MSGLVGKWERLGGRKDEWAAEALQENHPGDQIQRRPLSGGRFVAPASGGLLPDVHQLVRRGGGRGRRRAQEGPQPNKTPRERVSSLFQSGSPLR